ncbi:MAG: site-specific integrase [Dehalococcoidales bacterium]|nr:site-specific integrase [Dehalococcoidales bacterium]
MSTKFHALESPEVPDRLLDLAVADGRIDGDTRVLIKKYLGYLQGARSASRAHITNTTGQLILWRSLLNMPFEQATFDDLIQARVALDAARTKRGKPYAETSKKSYVIALKSFYYWLGRRGLSAIPRDALQEMRVPEPQPVTNPEDLIRSDDLTAMIMSCKNFRDRALIAVLFETGARISEVHRLRWHDLTFDRHGARVRLHDRKEKKTRHSRLITSVPHLAAWRNAYPGDPVNDHYVFIGRTGKPLSYSMMRDIVVRAADTITGKRITPHLFRKSRVTELIVTGCSESVVKESCWGNPNTKMFSKYLRLSAQDVDAGLLKAAGVDVTEEEKAQPRSVIHCPACHALCPPELKYCGVCMQPLTEEGRREREEISKLTEEIDLDALTKLLTLTKNEKFKKLIESL